MHLGGYSCRAIHFRRKMTCVADEWCPGGQARPPWPPSDCAEEGKASRTIVETSSSSFLPSTSTSLHLFKRSLASQRPFQRLCPVRSSEVSEGVRSWGVVCASLAGAGWGRGWALEGQSEPFGGRGTQWLLLPPWPS